MSTLKYLLFILLVWTTSTFHTQAQKVSTDSLHAEIDSLSTDSIYVDSIAMRLPWPQSVRECLDELMESPLLETSQVGLMVWDLDADSCIYRHNEKQLLRPASTMKLITAITAIDKLGGSYQFKTQLKYTGTIENGTLTGDIYCVGGMDPLFNSDDLMAFVNSLREMGIDTIKGNVYADKSLKDSDPYGEGWCWDDDNPTLTPLLLSRKDNFMPRFMERLKERGIVCGGNLKEGACPQGAFTACTRSHSINQVLRRMMKESDNLYAECMYYQIAAATGNRPATAKHARNLERQLVRKTGFDPLRYKYADGSGLSLYNYVSVELLTALLRYAHQDENIRTQLYQSLPIAGIDGTLKSRMRGSFTRGNVRAKTGTLTGIISLAGYCTAANGHQLCFAIINQGVMRGSLARQFQDRVCQVLCQPQ